LKRRQDNKSLVKRIRDLTNM